MVVKTFDFYVFLAEGAIIKKSKFLFFILCFPWFLLANHSGSFIQGGFSFSQVLPDESKYEVQPENSYKIGTRINGGYELSIFKNFALSLGIAYEKRGGYWEFDDNFENNININLKYLQLPLLMKLTLPNNNDTFRFGAAVGPEPAILLISSSSYNTGEGLEGASLFDFGINFYGVVEVITKTGAVLLQGGYGLGILDSVDDDEARIFGKNSSIRLSIGWKVRSAQN